MFACQQLEGVRKDVQNRPQTFRGPLAGAGCVENERLAAGARRGPRETTERVHEPHGLGHARCLAIEDDRRSFRREVPGAEAGSPGGDDQAGEAFGEVDQSLPHCLAAIGHDAPVHDLEPGAGEYLHEHVARVVVAGPGDDAVRDRRAPWPHGASAQPSAGSGRAPLIRRRVHATVALGRTSERQPTVARADHPAIEPPWGRPPSSSI